MSYSPGSTWCAGFSNRISRECTHTFVEGFELLTRQHLMCWLQQQDQQGIHTHTFVEGFELLTRQHLMCWLQQQNQQGMHAHLCWRLWATHPAAPDVLASATESAGNARTPLLKALSYSPGSTWCAGFSNRISREYTHTFVEGFELLTRQHLMCWLQQQNQQGMHAHLCWRLWATHPAAPDVLASATESAGNTHTPLLKALSYSPGSTWCAGFSNRISRECTHTFVEGFELLTRQHLMCWLQQQNQLGMHAHLCWRLWATHPAAPDVLASATESAGNTHTPLLKALSYSPGSTWCAGFSNRISREYTHTFVEGFELLTWQHLMCWLQQQNQQGIHAHLCWRLWATHPAAPDVLASATESAGNTRTPLLKALSYSPVSTWCAGFSNRISREYTHTFVEGFELLTRQHLMCWLQQQNQQGIHAHLCWKLWATHPAAPDVLASATESAGNTRTPLLKALSYSPGSTWCAGFSNRISRECTHTFVEGFELLTRQHLMCWLQQQNQQGIHAHLCWRLWATHPSAPDVLASATESAGNTRTPLLKALSYSPGSTWCAGFSNRISREYTHTFVESFELLTRQHLMCWLQQQNQQGIHAHLCWKLWATHPAAPDVLASATESAGNTRTPLLKALSYSPGSTWCAGFSNRISRECTHTFVEGFELEGWPASETHTMLHKMSLDKCCHFHWHHSGICTSHTFFKSKHDLNQTIKWHYVMIGN